MESLLACNELRITVYSVIIIAVLFVSVGLLTMF